MQTEHMFVIWNFIVARASKTVYAPRLCFSTKSSKAVSLLRIFVAHASAVSYVSFV